MYIPTELIPENDISITPKKLYNIVNQLLDKEIDYYNHIEIYVLLLNSVKKNILKRLKNTNLWKRDVLSEKVCEHVYGEYSKKFGQICGSRIDIKCKNNKFLCSQHIGIIHVPKRRSIPDDKKCKGITKYKIPCKKEGVNNGYCKHHVKDIIIENFEKENKILNNDKNCKIPKDITKQNINMDSLYNIIEKLKKKSKLIENKENSGNNINHKLCTQFIKDEEINELNNNIQNFKEKLKIKPAEIKNNNLNIEYNKKYILNIYFTKTTHNRNESS